MRSALVSTFALAAMLSTPALAQQANQQPMQADARQGQTEAMQALRSARQQLRTAAQQLEQASQKGDRQAVEKAEAEVRQAIDGVRQAMSELPPDQRAELQEGLRQAERGMQINDPVAMVQAAQRLDEAMDRSAGTVVALRTWSYDPLYAEGWRSEEIWDAEVHGPDGKEIGDIENVLVGPDGKIVSIIAEVGGFWDIGDTHVNVPWDQVKVGESFDGVTIPVTEDNVRDYSLFKDWHLTRSEASSETTQVDDDLAVGPRVWKLTDILDDYVLLAGNVPYGYVDDVVFDREGAIKAIVVRPDVTWGAPGPYAYPYYAWGPALSYHVLPYAREEITGLQRFDYDRLDGNRPSEG